jgi:hypothetical protein
MPDPTPYQLSLTAAQVDAALLAASPTQTDQAPASGDTNLVNSNRIHAAIAAEASTRASAIAALKADHIDPLVPRIVDFDGFYKEAEATMPISAGTYTPLSAVTVVSGDSVVSSSGGVLTMVPGVYEARLYVTAKANGNGVTMNLRVSGSNLASFTLPADDYSTFFTSAPLFLPSGNTVSISVYRFIVSGVVTYKNLLLVLNKIA